ncbi:hypothetical protein TWF481_006334 [Arthrobotrys musiformis]|uniref:NB-ARC domain-containing protein n=1 Tax=Arthrobotrys musiformis TaxID=47236 RepID=A0AAV9WM34_9PEZI
MGKTQIALEYGYSRHESHRFTAVFWVSTMTEESIQASFVNIVQQIIDEQARENWPSAPNYKAIGARLGISGLIDEKGKISGSASPGAFGTIKSALFSWFKLPGNNKWLLIFDNADDLNVPIEDYLPTDAGYILVTSRRPEFLHYGEQMGLGGLDRESAIQLLLRLTRLRDPTTSDIQDVTEVVEKLGFMPLAITHAGCFIYELRIPVNEYLQYYDQAFKEAQSKIPRLGWAYREDTAVTTWEVSFGEIKKRNEEAASLLLTCGYLNPNEIFENCWENEEQSDLQAQIRSKNRFSLLASYSLITRSQPGSFSVHPVVHNWTRGRGNDSDRLQAIGRAVEIVGKMIEGRQGMLGRWDGQKERRIAAHVDILLRYSEQYNIDEIVEQCANVEDTLNIFHKIAVILKEQGKYDRALEQFRRVLSSSKNIAGENDLDNLVTAHEIACCLYDQGKYDEALAQNQAILATKIKTVGEDHLSTYVTIHEVARCFDRQNKLDEALAQFQKFLDFAERTLGQDDIRTLVALHNMTTILDKQGKVDEALKNYERVLVGKTKILGENHPETLVTMQNIAVLSSCQGKLDEALQQFQKCLTAARKVLSEDHPWILDITYNMGTILRKQGKFEEALEQCRKALAGQENIRKDHPRTFDTIHEIGDILHSQKRYGEALEQYHRALVGRKKVLHKNHPATLDTIYKIGTTLREQGKWEEALEQFQELLVDLEETFGKSHRSTLDTVFNIGHVFHELKRYEEALGQFQRVLAIEEKTLGQDHPKNVFTRGRIQETTGKMKSVSPSE